MQSGVCMSDETGIVLRSVFVDTGEEVAEFTGSDFGNQPEWTKEDLEGQGIIFRGLSTEIYKPEGSSFPPARSVLYNLVTDDRDTEPWGMFFSDEGNDSPKTSTIIKQVRSEFRKNGGRPFLATIVNVQSEAHKGQSYWKLAKYVRNATPLP
jgi:hypothetical protein